MPNFSSFPVKILLADDDFDDRSFFKNALFEISPASVLTTVNDGEKLMEYLAMNMVNLPEVLFLDLSMPRKSGFECLSEIKESPDLNSIYVVMFSTFFSQDVFYEKNMVDILLNIGAQDFIRKPNSVIQFKNVIRNALIKAKHG